MYEVMKAAKKLRRMEVSKGEREKGKRMKAR